MHTARTRVHPDMRVTCMQPLVAFAQEESDMHALSWMAPDFDLDELL